MNSNELIQTQFKLQAQRFAAHSRTSAPCCGIDSIRCEEHYENLLELKPVLNIKQANLQYSLPNAILGGRPTML